MGLCGETGLPTDHSPSPWTRLDREEEIANHEGRTLWLRDCQWTECHWRQVTSHDPTDPEHPDGAIVK